MNILSILRALSQRYLRRGRRSGRTSIRRPSSWRPLVEALEDRSMLSSIQLLALGDGTFQLRVDGDAKANQVSIVGQAPTNQTNDYSLVVSCDQLKQMTVEHVSEVVIDTRGGADTVLLTGQWAFQTKDQTMSGVRSISIKTAGGDDSVKFIEFDGQSVNGDIPGPHIQIDTGNGDDLAWFRPIFHPPTLFAGLELSVRTGGGDDDVLVENLAFGPEESLPSRIGIDTAGGDDVVTLSNWTSDAGIGASGFNGDAPAYLIGMLLGKGDDALIVEGNSFGQGDNTMFALNAYADAGNDIVSVQDNSIAGAQVDFFLDLGKGDDTATIAENAVNGDWNATVNGDDGNDLVSVQDNSIAGAHVDFFLDLGKGEDSAMFALNSYIGELFMTVLGGDGRDLVTIQDDGFGPISLLVDLGDGRDTANISLTLGNQIPAKQPVTVRVLGGKGDDDLALSVKADPEILAAADLLIDGGSGFDHGVSGPSVKIVNCEQ